MHVVRKKIILIEKKKQDIRYLLNSNLENHSHLISNTNNEYFHSSRFFLELTGSDIFVNPYKISGYELINNDDKKILKIKTILDIEGWIDEFKKVNEVKIYLLDSYGNEKRMFDFDIIFKGYCFSGDYNKDGLLTPFFTYNIIE